MAGALAAVTVLPTIIPLTYRVVSTEETSVMHQVQGAGVAAAILLEAGSESPPDGLAQRMLVDGITILDRHGVTYADGMELSVDVLGRLCAADGPRHRYIVVDEVRWAMACYEAGESDVIAFKRPDTESVAFVGYLVLGLAAMVGISTALGVLAILSPISEVSASVARVSAGVRGARASATGLVELDVLVDHVNAAAQAMEDREDAIEGRLQVVQEMARLVAHEVRNPLQSMELLTSLIASEEEREEREQLAGSIHEEIRGLENVVGRMLRHTEHGTALRLQRTPTAMHELIEKVITFRRPEARHLGIRLEAGKLTSARAPLDRTLASRAIENLVVNAMKMVSAETGHVLVSAWENDTHVAVVVDDNGPGVDPSLSDSIYQPHVTGRPGGTGLGLSLVVGVTTAHDGYVEHARSPLGGARFQAWFAKDPTGGGPVANPGGGRQPIERAGAGEGPPEEG